MFEQVEGGFCCFVPKVHPRYLLPLWFISHWSLRSRDDIKARVRKNIFAKKSFDFPPKALNRLGSLPKREFVPSQLPGYPDLFAKHRSAFGRRAWDKENIINIFLHDIKISSNIMKRKYCQYFSQ